MTIPRTTPHAPRPEGIERDLSLWTDEALVTALREGENAAYEHLWLRHVDAGTRVARRWAPTQADDLVSEAFLTVYDQIRHQGKGPTSAFRAYLFAVIRNIAARWHREGTRLVNDPEADVVIEETPLRELVRSDDRAMLLHAFRALPPRWQRILWLTDVEDAARPVIASELGVRPNAVSSLHRRARNGLRLQWLEQHVPADLRDDPAHVAAELPQAIIRGPIPMSMRFSQHLAACPRCAAVDAELRSAYRDGRKAATSVGGLAALGVVLPAASSWLITPVTITVAAGLGPLGAAAIAAGVLALSIGATTLSMIEPTATDTAAAVSEVGSPATRHIAKSVPTEILVTPPPPPSPAAIPPLPESSISEIAIRFDPSGPFGFPERPTPTTPAAPGSTTPPGTGDEAPEAPAVVASTPSSEFLAPVLRGSVQSVTQVAVSVGTNTYRLTPDAAGDWLFDARSLALPAGTHTATVWTITDRVSSKPTTATFTIRPIVLDGFPDSYPSVTLRDGMVGGISFTMTGAPNGAVCVESDTGQSAVVPLDATGSATRVLRFYNYGIYVLRLSACDGGAFGPDTGRVVAVTEGLFDPYVLDDVMFWDISDS
ncbi:MAG: sigma-70 family RNA polymerase sigma factor [Microbacterium sp.]